MSYTYTHVIVGRAEMLAREVHRGQIYPSQENPFRPYTHHLEAVVREMFEIGSRAERHVGTRPDVMLAAAWLHDALEDTHLRASKLHNMFGPSIAFLVEAVTDAPGATRFERKRATYLKIRSYGPSAVALKLADRIANVTAALCDLNFEKLGMYQREQGQLFRALYRSADKLDEAWEHLDALLEGHRRPWRRM